MTALGAWPTMSRIRQIGAVKTIAAARTTVVAAPVVEAARVVAVRGRVVQAVAPVDPARVPVVAAERPGAVDSAAGSLDREWVVRAADLELARAVAAERPGAVGSLVRGWVDQVAVVADLAAASPVQVVPADSVAGLRVPAPAALVGAPAWADSLQAERDLAPARDNRVVLAAAAAPAGRRLAGLGPRAAPQASI